MRILAMSRKRDASHSSDGNRPDCSHPTVSRFAPDKVWFIAIIDADASSPAYSPGSEGLPGTVKGCCIPQATQQSGWRQ